MGQIILAILIFLATVETARAGSTEVPVFADIAKVSPSANSCYSVKKLDGNYLEKAVRCRSTDTNRTWFAMVKVPRDAAGLIFYRIHYETDAAPSTNLSWAITAVAMSNGAHPMIMPTPLSGEASSVTHTTAGLGLTRREMTDYSSPKYIMDAVEEARNGSVSCSISPCTCVASGHCKGTMLKLIIKDLNSAVTTLDVRAIEVSIL